jgi:hypothetical protein
MVARPVGSHADGPLDQRQRDVRSADLMGQQPEQVQRFRVGRGQGQRLSIVGLGLSKLASLVQRHALRHGLVSGNGGLGGLNGSSGLGGSTISQANRGRVRTSAGPWRGRRRRSVSSA